MSLTHPTTSSYKFRFEPFLLSEYALGRDVDRDICPDFDARDDGHPNGGCPRGSQCPFKHIPSLFHNKIVCKHWLRGLCKKGSRCEFLHEYNLRRMPECVFFARNGFCTQAPECPYRHVKPEDHVELCTDYQRGFCPRGPSCARRHVNETTTTLCQCYLTGFCPLGSSQCPYAHPETLPPLPWPRDFYLRIRPDSQIHTRKSDMEKEKRLNAILNGDV
ncbi:hypothetical protein TBLA_0C02360 [Henningerozyma blattae CBS 6284]|uniref:mRNA 3'-end-processing protein n=1 Tax=Henningerozyma blattae (strain ATCC 34711 / CBS 6284 / DSM 70876 / NBRC 10599 / NRRL Y-10934 / UCD 77-7) TaxID=1071380 RepID=I2H0Z5_HENB6|nr:hypothetical protein TBLA_0C02360 [Tetrapisispora blattae CBS 6284]CCH60047.1 hypothetical protein TBLA_0C02360 [Tetrapisispora blattae CBS 6284]